MTKLTFDWKKIKDENYIRYYNEVRESNREECKKVVELKYGKLMKKTRFAWIESDVVEDRLLKKLIRRCCEKYGFEDAWMNGKTSEIEIF